MRQIARLFALGVIAVLVCTSIPAFAGQIPGDGFEMERGSRSHGIGHSGHDSEITGNNPFVGGPPSAFRPGRGNQFIVRYEDNEELLDDQTNRDHDRGVRQPPDNEQGLDQPLPESFVPTAPVPEPATLALVAPAVLGLIRRRRK